MGKQRGKFDIGFNQQIIGEVESGVLTVNAASRKYQISGTVIDRWRRQDRKGGLEATPPVREKVLERENRELMEKLASLSLENAHLKRLGDWLRQRKSASTSVIPAQSLARSPKDSKS
jgi:transposase-like protein